MSSAAPGAKVFGKGRSLPYNVDGAEGYFYGKGRTLAYPVDEAERSLQLSRAQPVKATIQLRPPDLTPSSLYQEPAKINLFAGEASRDLSRSIKRRLDLLSRQLSSIRAGMRLACGGLNGTSDTAPSPLKKMYELLEEMEEVFPGTLKGYRDALGARAGASHALAGYSLKESLIEASGQIRMMQRDAELGYSGADELFDFFTDAYLRFDGNVRPFSPTGLTPSPSDAEDSDGGVGSSSGGCVGGGVKRDRPYVDSEEYGDRLVPLPVPRARAEDYRCRGGGGGAKRARADSDSDDDDK